MSEILLQTIIEKLEALEIALLKQDKADNDSTITKEIAEQTKKIRSGLDNFCADFNLINERIIELTKKADNDTTNLPPSVLTKIEHRHHLHKGTWISAGLLITAILLSWAWFYTYQNKKVSEANDIKYRALKTTGNKILLDLLYNTDSLYHRDEAAFRRYVVDRENQLVKQAEMSRIAGEKKRKIMFLFTGSFDKNIYKLFYTTIFETKPSQMLDEARISSLFNVFLKFGIRAKKFIL